MTTKIYAVDDSWLCTFFMHMLVYMKDCKYRSFFYIQKCGIFTGTEEKAPDNSYVHRLLQIFGSSVWNSLCHPPFLAPRIWRWLPDFWKLCSLM